MLNKKYSQYLSLNLYQKFSDVERRSSLSFFLTGEVNKHSDAEFSLVKFFIGLQLLVIVL